MRRETKKINKKNEKYAPGKLSNKKKNTYKKLKKNLTLIPRKDSAQVWNHMVVKVYEYFILHQKSQILP